MQHCIVGKTEGRGRLETDRKPDLTPAIFLLFGTMRSLEALGIAADVAAAMVNVQPGVNA